ncbi:MAG TPA: FTR1 family protein [Burkholderiaceae bacterium]
MRMLFSLLAHVLTPASHASQGLTWGLPRWLARAFLPWAAMLAAALTVLPALAANADAVAPKVATPARGVNFTAVARDLVAHGDALAQAYDPAQGPETSAAFSGLYFGAFEGSGMEMKLRALDAGGLARTEARFAAVVDAAMRGQPRPQLDGRWRELRADLLLAGAALGGNAAPDFRATLAESLVILLREGTEVALVLAALVFYLRRIGAADRLYLIYGGALAGLVLSLATAWLALRLLGSTGGLGALTEGIAMLAAAAMLFYLSNWLVGRRQAASRSQYIEGQLRQAVAGGNGLALAVMALLAVYREGAETTLFYVALLAQPGVDVLAMWAGAGGAALLLAAGWLALRRFTLRIPFGAFFSATAVLMLLLAVVFTGRGVFALQLAGWLRSTAAAGVPVLPWLGLSATWQALGTQLLVLAAGLGWMLWSHRHPPASAVGA